MAGSLGGARNCRFLTDAGESVGRGFGRGAARGAGSREGGAWGARRRATGRRGATNSLGGVAPKSLSVPEKASVRSILLGQNVVFACR